MATDRQHGTLQRSVGSWSALLLVAASMIGTGIFTTGGLMMADLGSPRLLLAAWAAGGAFALAGALCYGELGARLPRAGGEYAFLQAGFGPLAGFLAGWVSLVVGFSAPIAASAMAFAAYALAPWPASNTELWLLSLGGAEVLCVSVRTLLALAAILGLSAVHARSLSGGLSLQNWLTAGKLLLISAFLAAGFLSLPAIDSETAGPAASPGLFSPAFAVALVYVSFAYSGWNAAAYLGGEIARPRRNLPLALIAGTLGVMALYLLLNYLFVLILGPSRMSGVVEVGALAARVLLGPAGEAWFSAAVALFLLSNTGAMILSGPRVYYAMAADGLFFQSLARLDRRGRTPSRAVLLQAAIAMALVLTASFSWLLIYIGLTLSLCTSAAVVVLMALRRREPGPGLLPAFVIWPAATVFVAGNLWIIAYTLTVRPWAGAAVAATLAAGALAYAFFERRLPACVVPDVAPDNRRCPSRQAAAEP